MIGARRLRMKLMSCSMMIAATSSSRDQPADQLAGRGGLLGGHARRSARRAAAAWHRWRAAARSPATGAGRGRGCGRGCPPGPRAGPGSAPARSARATSRGRRAEASTASSTFSSTGRLSNTLGVWNLRPMPRLARAGNGQVRDLARPVPDVPAVGLRWPEIMLMKVVLPAPFGPMTQRSSPLASGNRSRRWRAGPGSAWSGPRCAAARPCALSPAAAREQAADRAGDAAPQDRRSPARTGCRARAASSAGITALR